MKIIDLEFHNLFDLFSQITGGLIVSCSGSSVSDDKVFDNISRGFYYARFKAFAKGGKKSFTGGYAKGRVYRVGSNVISKSSSLSISVAD